MLKAQARLGYYESPTSKPTLRRWCTKWIKNHLAIWEQTRKGSKYVAEHIVKTIHRDARLCPTPEGKISALIINDTAKEKTGLQV